MRLFRFLALFFALPVFVLHAQVVMTTNQDVLRPVQASGRLSVLLGGGGVYSTGTFRTTCACEFDGGWGFDVFAGARVEVFPLEKVSVGLSVLGGWEHVAYTQKDTRLEFIQTGDQVPVDFERTVTLSLPTVRVELRGDWYPGLTGLSVFAGPFASFSFSESIFEKERITTPGYAYFQNRTNEMTYLDEPLGNRYTPHRPRLGAFLGVGLEWLVTDKLLLHPELAVSHTFDSFVSQHKKWTDTSIRLSVALGILEW